MISFLDADIVIWLTRGSAEASQLLGQLTQKSGRTLAMLVAQRAEVVFFLRDVEVANVERLLSGFEMHPVTTEIVDFAASLCRRWHPSHGIGVNDALLAAAATLVSGEIVTQNVKHFPMPEVRVRQGWDPRSP
ncbi:hypothetical protein AYO38_08435 [bacterium SCGC AG-212-C10]|nr:hypothetical protein AYO38_08435 [bacterium SCGC AG-212-C10]